MGSPARSVAMLFQLIARDGACGRTPNSTTSRVYRKFAPRGGKNVHHNHYFSTALATSRLAVDFAA